MLPDVEVDSYTTSKQRSRKFERALDRGRWHLNPSIVVSHDKQGVVAKLKDNKMYSTRIFRTKCFVGIVQVGGTFSWRWIGHKNIFKHFYTLLIYTHLNVKVGGDKIRDVHSVYSFPRSRVNRSVLSMLVTVAYEAESGEGVTVGPSLVVGH